MASVRRVLILEDESGLATRIADCLEDAGYDVAGPVRNVLEAKRVVGLDGVDCAVISADLASENPMSLAHEISKQRVPVLILAQSASLRGAESGGRYRRLTKPISPRQLVSEIDAIFAPKAA